jgi:hypothetical protein
MTQTVSPIVRDRVLDKVLRNADYARKKGASLDSSVVALAMWIADPGEGSFRAFVGDVREQRAVYEPPVLKSIMYVQAQGFVGKETEWDSEGADAFRRIQEMETAAAAVGSVVRRFSVDIANLAGFRNEFGLPDVALGDLRVALEGVEATDLNRSRLAIARAACAPGARWGDLAAEPFVDTEFLRLAMEHGSAALRTHLACAPESIRIRVTVEAIEDGSVEWIEAMLDSGVSPNAKEDGVEWNLIHLAACSNAVSVQILLERGAGVMLRDHLGNTPLHYATQSPRSCEVLLNAGAKMYALNDAGVTPLHEMLKRPIMQREQLGEMIAALDMMITRGANPSYVPPNPSEGYLTPFQSAIKFGAPEQVEAILRRCSIDLSERTLGGRTLTQLASKSEPMKQFLRAWKAERNVIGAVVTGEQADPATPASAPRSSAGGPI